ncbi:Retinol dehydrogenase 13 [Dufourea novaeangliae]|uniref:Retinol dehydrogenase 13 n=1 Tax=Dufourea novaeangliae TaxID=178035 RepID=A0A154PH65_DUFNO|nr:Retinol dehydrogenase 13 [Dufourea novaeangliae]
MGLSLPKPFYFYSTGITLVGSGYLLRDYIGGPNYENDEKLNEKVAIVTGSNTGIGKQVVHELAKRGAKVIMACRDMEKCETARCDIVLTTGNKYVYCRKCDLASQESIRQFVTQFQKEHSKLHILINNAGVMRCPKSYTNEGIEMQLGVNHMGHFLLTNLLLDVLKDSTPARIINVSSAAHLRGTMKLKDLNRTGITVNAVHPGVVHTEIVRHMGFNNSYISRLIVKSLLWLFVKSSMKGAQPVLYVALDPSLQDVTGAYFSNFRMADISEEAKNDQIAKWLWVVSEKWTKLSFV